MVASEKYTVSDITATIREIGSGVTWTAVREVLGCSDSTLRKYRRKYDEIEATFDRVRAGEDDPAAAGRGTRYDEATVLAAIDGSRGIIPTIAQRLDVSENTVRNYAKRWPAVAEAIDEEREAIVNMAESALVTLITVLDSKAILFTLRTLGKNRGWSERTEITGADGASLFDDETVRMMQALGVDPRDAVAQFEALIKAQYEASHAERD